MMDSHITYKLIDEAERLLLSLQDDGIAAPVFARTIVKAKQGLEIEKCTSCLTPLIDIAPAYWLIEDLEEMPEDGDSSVEVRNNICARYCPNCKSIIAVG